MGVAPGNERGYVCHGADPQPGVGPTELARGGGGVHKGLGDPVDAEDHHKHAVEGENGGRGRGSPGRPVQVMDQKPRIVGAKGHKAEADQQDEAEEEGKDCAGLVQASLSVFNRAVGIVTLGTTRSNATENGRKREHRT